MANKMLIDATHPEETRVVVLRGNRVEEFDFETAHRRQLRGNIYLAKVARVEPSLQAAFVDYGGNRHGFLAFSEIHPDYYQIPIADRQALIEDDIRAAREYNNEDENGHRSRRSRGARRNHERPHPRHDETVQHEPLESESHAVEDAAHERAEGPASEQPLSELPAGLQSASETAEPRWPDAGPTQSVEIQTPASKEASAFYAPPGETANPSVPTEIETPSSYAEVAAPTETEPSARSDAPLAESADHPSGQPGGYVGDEHEEARADGPDEEEEEVVDTIGGADALEEALDRTPRYRRQYKIQEVIKRRQVMLVQVVKEERGTKGAALTTYLSLAGRYCVLMPNTARGGGISRKITSLEDRKKLREIADQLEVPEGMGVILRTAGASRTNAEVKRDFEYLLRLWEQVRDLTLKSTAPMLVYEEGSLVKRSIRDLFTKDIDEIAVAGEQGYSDAKEFMRMLMPSHARNVKLYRDSQPIFTRYGIESQLDAMFSPTVQLRSGGYIVINQTEALVSIDVNSGRATREHHIEDTALKTNAEAAEEIARQLRLRDLAGLIVIDFIDMDEKRNNRSVERRLKESLRSDRARIQVGRISHFGLLEMSRQRIRTSVLESSTEKCPHCGGTGHVRSVSSVTLQMLRAIEETLLKGPTHDLIVRALPDIAQYALNQKRANLRNLEERFQVSVTVGADAAIGGHVGFSVERGEPVRSMEQAKDILTSQASTGAPVLLEEEEPETTESFDEEYPAEDAGPERESNVSIARPDYESGRADETAAPYGGEDASLEGETPRERSRRRRRRRGRGGRGGEIREGGSVTPNPHRETGVAGPHTEFAPDVERGEPQPGMSPHEGPAEFGSTARHDEASEYHGSGEGNGGRRRRRGRRGGRRRGREGNGQPELATTPDLDRQYPDRSDRVNEARPRLEESADRSSTATEIPPPAQIESRVSEPVPAAPQESVAAPEPPRRRSTVREPVPIQTAEHSAPVPAPLIHPASPPSPPEAETTTETDEAQKPRRTGWWSRRLLGG